MLNFLRKHQRIFFIVITVTIVVSFCFFGTYSTLSHDQEILDKEIVRGVKGTPIMKQELSALCHLIDTSSFDRSTWKKGDVPNFLNNGVIEKDFLSHGLGAILAKCYFEEIKPDLEARLLKIRSFRPYVHHHTAQISAEGIWARFSPSLLQHFRMVQEIDQELTSEMFVLISQLYLDQMSFPSDILKQILSMQQSQLGIQPDPILTNSDLSLFGFKSLEDWLGRRFVLLIGQFILNAAQIAEENGYEVKKEEVRADLFQNIYRGYQENFREAQQLSPEEADHYYQQKIRNMGLDETMVINAWKKVMLFRRLFEDGSGSVLIDPLAYQQFHRFAKENVRLSLYQLPHSLQLGDFRSMLKLQLYIEAVASDPTRLRNDLRLPTQFASLEQIGKRVPELIEHQMEVEWSEVSREELSKTISIKDTWEWEIKDNHWELLKANFSELSSSKANSPQERRDSLDQLDKKLRIKIDQFSRFKMVDEQSDKIKLALDLAPKKTSALSLRIKGTIFPFVGVTEATDLMAFLEKSALKEETPNVANERLSYYTPDHEHYYRIRVVSRENVKKVLSFADAANDGTLDTLLDKRLEESYPEIRKRNPHNLQQANGQFKPFKEVKDQIGKHLFVDLLRSIEDHYRIYFGFLPGKEGDLPLGFYSNARLLRYMCDMQSHLRSHPEDSSVIKSDSTNQAESLSSQWLIEKTEKVMERCTEASFSKEEMFTLSPQQWSPVKIGEKGTLAFYFVQEKGIPSAIPLDTVEQGHQILSSDAKRDMMLQILQKIQQKKAIDLSIAVKETQP